jgi:hypothetical protein
MQFNDLLLEALNTVLGWDIPDEACSEAISSQACLLAGVEPERVGGCEVD